MAKTYKVVDKVQMFKRKFELITMKKSKTIELYFFRLVDIKNEMENNGHDFSDEVLVETALILYP